MNYFRKIIIFLFISLIFLFRASSSSCGDEFIKPYKIQKANITVFKTNIVLSDKSGNVIDSLSLTPYEIKDFAIDPVKDYLFVILGKDTEIRGQKLALFSINSNKIAKVWIDEDRGHNPWKIELADVDGDDQIDVIVGVWNKARFHPVYANRLFIYSWDGDQIFPKWLGSRLSSPFSDFDLWDIDEDGIIELLSLEDQRNGLKRIMSYKWKGFGFEGYKVLGKDLKINSLHKFIEELEGK